MKKLLILDFYAVFHRCRNAMKKSGRSFTTSDGIPTTGVFPFLNNVLAVIKDQQPTHVVCCYDAGGNKRKVENKDYKANRKKNDDDFYTEARILLDEALYALGIECVGLKGYEADDCIWTLSHQARFGISRFDETIIFTCDQDLLACVGTKCKVLLFNSAKKQTMMGVEEVIEKWGCEPEDIGWVKALSGDGSDNIKGVKGIGPKTAVRICEASEWNPDIILAHSKIRDYEELVRTNLELVRLRRVTELGMVSMDDYALGKGRLADYEQFLSKYELSSLAKRVAKTAELCQLVGSTTFGEDYEKEIECNFGSSYESEIDSLCQSSN